MRQEPKKMSLTTLETHKKLISLYLVFAVCECRGYDLGCQCQISCTHRVFCRFFRQVQNSEFQRRSRVHSLG